ncbi:MAG: hypothetical protein KZQ58_11050 [gamma proteobacterium symbiont of Bathyaustriella thionipta]|nr:hypothetical protein [gamma proteobacterium symbiont of Bathyaustriella thionipta]
MGVSKLRIQEKAFTPVAPQVTRKPTFSPVSALSISPVFIASTVLADRSLVFCAAAISILYDGVRLSDAKEKMQVVNANKIYTRTTYASTYTLFVRLDDIL